MTGIVADVATADGRQQTLDDALSGLDILVNNAGGVRAGQLEQLTEEDILAMIAVDLTAPILLTRAALPALRGSGRWRSRRSSPILRECLSATSMGVGFTVAH